MSGDVMSSSRDREGTLRKAIHSRNPEDYLAYTKARNACTAAARKTQTRSWRDYCYGINKNVTSKKLWQKVKAMKKESKKQGVSTLLDTGGKRSAHQKEKPTS
jgi:hypothetical protein